MQKEHDTTVDPADDPAAAAQSMTPGAVEQQLSAALAERDANYDRWLRAQAEFDNYRKRVQREVDDERKFAPLPFVRDLLPALDNLRRAADAARTGGESGNLVQGIDLVLQQIEQALGRHGVEPIPAVGQTFDPHLHEALTQLPSAEHPPLTVLQELERGYKLHERVVRPGKVIVSQAAQ